MDECAQSRFDGLSALHTGALKLQDKAVATLNGYSRAARRVAGYFDRCSDQISAEDFTSLIDNRSWAKC